MAQDVTAAFTDWVTTRDLAAARGTGQTSLTEGALFGRKFHASCDR
jgi:hypothetical protein